jgi:hypothetical protein
MIELDVETRRKAPLGDSEARDNYLILGDFGGGDQAGRSSSPVLVDLDNVPYVLDRLGVTLGGSRIRQLDDFHPDNLFQRLSFFRGLREEKPAPPAPSQPRHASPDPDIEKILRPSSLLEQMAGGSDPFENYLRELTEAHAASPPTTDPERANALGGYMRAVLRNPRVQALEAAWRGLDFVLRRVEDQSTRIYLAQCSAQDLAGDLLSSKDLGATRTNTLLRARKWSGVIGLFSFGAESTDIELLGRIALLAASVDVPFIAEGSVDMGPYWDDLRSIPEAGYIGLALPRFLLRLPYGSRTSPIESFEFEEMPDAPVHSGYLWGNPALACLALAASPAAAELDLEDLPLHTYPEDTGEWACKPCAELLMTETQVEALIELGLMPLVGFRDSDRVRLAGFRAINGKLLSLAA